MHQSLVKHEKWQLDYSYKTNKECKMYKMSRHALRFKFTTICIN